MRIGSVRYGWYVFTVFDDGSLACGRTWYEDPPTAARELKIDPDLLVPRVIRLLEEWRNRNAAGC